MISCPICLSDRAIAGTLAYASGLCLTWECQVCTTVWERGAGFRTATVFRRGSVKPRPRTRGSQEAAA